MRNVLPLLLALALLAVSCKTVSKVIHDDQVVARVGDHKLYRSEVERLVPAFASSEDSLNYANKYINNWAAEILYAEVAEAQLSKAELDVTEQLEDYRRSLLKYRYEQKYINDRLDTLITDAQVHQYYEAHKSSFNLERPILKVRFIDIMKDAPAKDEILKLMSSQDYDKLARAASLASASTIRYFDGSDTWMDALQVAKEFGTDVSTMLSHMSGQFIRMESDDRGDLMAAYVVDIVKSGIAPLEYCEASIRDMILSARKHALLGGLEQDLLKDARDHNKFEVYE